MKVNEIFKSIQGESIFQGLPCIFVRLTGCNLRCSYCDTKYAYEEGDEISVDEIICEIGKYDCKLIEITGGEPLLQPEVYDLSYKLLALDYKILVDTNGSIPVERLAPEIIRILDIKCPGSGMSDRMYWDNLKNLRHTDEIKFVCSDKQDYEWAKSIVKKYSLPEKVDVVSFSPAFGRISPASLAEWIMVDNLNVRLQLQLHKYIGLK
ncbi:MAG: radical SAM protein [bacterium]|nr:radical SAM protein [bacterium]